MKVDLIPCPECGAGAELKQSFYFGMDQTYSYVHCTNPECDLFCHNPHFTGHSAEENDEHAAASWNERFVETLPLKKEEFLKIHEKDEHGTFFGHLLASFSWDKVLPFHEPHSHR
jgi:hypothetical protein